MYKIVSFYDKFKNWENFNSKMYKIVGLMNIQFHYKKIIILNS